MNVNDSYGIGHESQFTSHLLGLVRSGKICSKTVLISWKHTDIPNLAHQLGCGPKEGCPADFDEMDFDSVWEIRYTYTKEKYAPFPEKDKHKHKYWGLNPEWLVFGKVTKESFDPLAYSKSQGTY